MDISLGIYSAFMKVLRVSPPEVIKHTQRYQLNGIVQLVLKIANDYEQRLKYSPLVFVANRHLLAL